MFVCSFLATLLIITIAIPKLPHSEITEVRTQTLGISQRQLLGHNLQYDAIENFSTYKHINDILPISSNMTKTINNNSTSANKQNNISQQPFLNITDNQSGKFKKFGNFTQILQGTRRGFNDTVSKDIENQTLNMKENRSKTSEFTP
jgi:hypothetical protein